MEFIDTSPCMNNAKSNPEEPDVLDNISTNTLALGNSDFMILLFLSCLFGMLIGSAFMKFHLERKLDYETRPRESSFQLIESVSNPDSPSVHGPFGLYDNDQDNL